MTIEAKTQSEVAIKEKLNEKLALLNHMQFDELLTFINFVLKNDGSSKEKEYVNRLSKKDRQLYNEIKIILNNAQLTKEGKEPQPTETMIKVICTRYTIANFLNEKANDNPGVDVHTKEAIKQCKDDLRDVYVQARGYANAQSAIGINLVPILLGVGFLAIGLTLLSAPFNPIVLTVMIGFMAAGIAAIAFGGINMAFKKAKALQANDDLSIAKQQFNNASCGVSNDAKSTMKFFDRVHAKLPVHEGENQVQTASYQPV